VCVGVPLTGLMRDFNLSDGDIVEMRLGTDGKTLDIRDNHTVDEGVDSSATHQELTQ
jgi:hypothetical protein